MNKGWVGRSAPILLYVYAYRNISIFRSVSVPTCRPADLAADRGTNMNLNIYYKVFELGMCLLVGRSAGRQVGTNLSMWLCKGIKHSVISTRITVDKPSRSSRQVGRSALIWAFIYIIKYEYGVGRQVGTSMLTGGRRHLLAVALSLHDDWGSSPPDPPWPCHYTRWAGRQVDTNLSIWLCI